MEPANSKSVKDLRSMFESNIQTSQNMKSNEKVITEADRKKRNSVQIKKIKSPFLQQIAQPDDNQKPVVKSPRKLKTNIFEKK